MRISAEAAECTERTAAMTRPVRRIKGHVPCWSKHWGRRSRVGAPDLARPRALVDHQVTAAEQLLDRLGAVPPAGKPQPTCLVPYGDGDGIHASRLPVVRHRNLEGRIPVDGDRDGTRDVLDVRLAVEYRAAGRVQAGRRLH